MNNLTAIVLAAGQGTRMKSKKPKVLHEVCGKPLVEHIVDGVETLGCTKTILVVGHGKEAVMSKFENRNVDFAVQSEILGTGHAVMMAEEHIDDDADILILAGDTPLIESGTLKAFYDCHKSEDFSATVLTADFEDPYGYGRIIRNDEQAVVGIVEEKDATEEQRAVKEINSAIFWFKGSALKYALKNIGNDNAQGEYYLTDAVEILVGNGQTVGGFKITDNIQISGINSRKQLSSAEAIMKARIIERFMDEGVTFIDPTNTYVDAGVTIGMDTVVYPGTHLQGNTVIGEDCKIGPDVKILNSRIDDEVEISYSTILDSSVGSYTKVGPYAYLRPNSKIGKNVKVGDFVEVKNSTIDDNSKVSHLSYIGDGHVGKNVNIGCGVVFVNYNGKEKNTTTVMDNAFVGCNVNLIAPVTVEEYGYVAAGSTITNDVPKASLGVARAKQRNISHWVEKKGYLEVK